MKINKCPKIRLQEGIITDRQTHVACTKLYSLPTNVNKVEAVTLSEHNLHKVTECVSSCF